MNAANAESPPPVPQTPRAGWPFRKLFLLVALAVGVHLTLVFLFGTKQQTLPRAVGPVPQLRLANSAGELIALTDPTLFVLPHANDFTTAFWQRKPAVTPPDFRWTEPAQFLLRPAANSLGATFREFMQTNRFADVPMEFKPEAVLSEVTGSFESVLPQATTMQISGDLAQRRRLNQIQLPSIPVNDVIAPSKVQALVDTAGNVASAVLLESSACDPADQRALTLTRRLRFAPAAQLTVGEIIFHWQTVPTNAP